MFDGKIQVEPNELERGEFVNKMLYILSETTRLKAKEEFRLGIE